MSFDKRLMDYCRELLDSSMVGLAPLSCGGIVYNVGRIREELIMIAKLIQDKKEDILRIAQRHGARNVRIFGSVARGEADEQSDIDFLVDMEPGRSLLDLGGLLMDLQELLGRDVDVVTEDGIYWLLRRRILKEAVPL
jgi:hypothetical protein